MRKRPNNTQEVSSPPPKAKSRTQDKEQTTSEAAESNTLVKSVPLQKESIYTDYISEADDNYEPTASWKKLTLVIFVILCFTTSLFFYSQWKGHLARISYRDAERALAASKMPVVHPHSLEAHELGVAGGVVAVIGAGLAGLSAATAVALSDANIKVILIDKFKVNGNSVKATSGINGVNTRWQRADSDGQRDSVEAFVDDILKSGRGLSNENIARALASRSNTALEFLAECGVEFASVERLGGHTYPRTHRIAGTPAVGWKIVNSVKQRLIKTERIQIIEDSKVTNLKIKRLPTGEPIVTGVEYMKGTETQSLHVDAVVLAAGGFAADRTAGGVLSEHGDNLLKYSTTNGSFATGDMTKLAIGLGMQTLHLDQIQLHPTAFVDPASPAKLEKFCCPEVFRGTGAILINKMGNRFVNELGTRDVVANASLANGTETSAWPPLFDASDDTDTRKGADVVNALVFNGKTRSRIGETTVSFYEAKKFVKKIGDVKAAAEYLGVPLAHLQSTLETYEAATSGAQDEFGKTVFPEVITANDTDLHAAFVTPATHYTMGGLRVNTDCQVCFEFSNEEQDSDVCEAPAINLFAAGEVSGGLHGSNRLGGNGLLESVAFGLHAGHRAALAASTVKEVTASSSVDVLGRTSLDQYTRLEIREVFSFNNPSSVPASDVTDPRLTTKRDDDTVRLIRFNLESPFSQIQFVPGRTIETLVAEDGVKYGLTSEVLPPVSLAGIHRGFIDILVAKPPEDNYKLRVLWSAKSGDEFYVRSLVTQAPGWIRLVESHIVAKRMLIVDEVAAAEKENQDAAGSHEGQQQQEAVNDTASVDMEEQFKGSGDKSGHVSNVKLRVFVRGLAAVPSAMQMIYVLFPDNNQSKLEVHFGGPSAGIISQIVLQQTRDAYYPNSRNKLRSDMTFEAITHNSLAALEEEINSSSNSSSADTTQKEDIMKSHNDDASRNLMNTIDVVL